MYLLLNNLNFCLLSGTILTPRTGLAAAATASGPDGCGAAGVGVLVSRWRLWRVGGRRGQYLVVVFVVVYSQIIHVELITPVPFKGFYFQTEI